MRKTFDGFWSTDEDGSGDFNFEWFLVRGRNGACKEGQGNTSNEEGFECFIN